MELSLCHTNSHYFCSSYFPARKTKNPSTQFQTHHHGNSSVPWKNHGSSLIQQSVGVGHKKPAVVVVRSGDMGCSSSGSASEIERELEAEMLPEEGAEWLGAGRLREKCGGGRGVVELLECLEREAIMGEDEGKEPDDYNRRAQIFYKSSAVFQALKERA